MLTEHVFVWVDIEDHPDLLGDEEVENFPTILLESEGDIRFFGTMLPHIQQLQRLIQTISTNPDAAPIQTALPDVRRLLV
jgi:thioredoxin 1